MHEDSTQYRRQLGGRVYFSQACQDLFVLEMLDQKKGGYYCEIGGAHPYDSSNTYLLEAEYDWNGFSVELNNILVEQFNAVRRNPCINHDATTCNYKALFESKRYPVQMDYLSIDIDPAEVTFKALLEIPFETYRFSVITYEHDAYVSGTEYMERARQFLTAKGYQLVVGNLKCFGRDFEDWWVDPKIIPESRWKKRQATAIEFTEVLK